MNAKKRMKLIQTIQKIENNSKYAERIGTKNVSILRCDENKAKEGRKS